MQEIESKTLKTLSGTTGEIIYLSGPNNRTMKVQLFQNGQVSMLADQSSFHFKRTINFF